MGNNDGHTGALEGLNQILDVPFMDWVVPQAWPSVVFHEYITYYSLRKAISEGKLPRHKRKARRTSVGVLMADVLDYLGLDEETAAELTMDWVREKLVLPVLVEYTPTEPRQERQSNRPVQGVLDGIEL